jgi:hypothetical protein
MGKNYHIFPQVSTENLPDFNQLALGNPYRKINVVPR